LLNLSKSTDIWIISYRSGVTALFFLSASEGFIAVGYYSRLKDSYVIILEKSTHRKTQIPTSRVCVIKLSFRILEDEVGFLPINVSSRKVLLKVLFVRSE
jgi:hypothetical protein